MPAPIRVLFVASECAPLAKTGGLGDVVGALPVALASRGLDVRVVLPLYGNDARRASEPLDGTLRVPTWRGETRTAVRVARLPRSEVPVYLLDEPAFFERGGLYGSGGEDFDDNLERFAFLSRAAVELPGALGWTADVVHAHDWQTALAPVYLRAKAASGQARPASVYTIHNLAFQGVHAAEDLPMTGLEAGSVDPARFEHHGAVNLAKAALIASTMLTTVSPTYAREILAPEGGCSLDGVLGTRRDSLVGILNGIDPDEWNPGRDDRIAAQFDSRDTAGKARCKAALQAEAGLEVREDVPLFAVVSRLAWQKGIDLVASVLDDLLDVGAQVVVLGTGDTEMERRLASAASRRSDGFAAWLGFDDTRAHRLVAGADFLLMPSRFEPCGLSQLYALRYGALPVARATGGLIDTVTDCDADPEGGNGFVFGDADADSLLGAALRAVSLWKTDADRFVRVRRRAMESDFSWNRTSAAYERVYDEAMRRERTQP